MALAMSEATYPGLKVRNGWRVRDGRAFQLMAYLVRNSRTLGTQTQRSIGWAFLLDGRVRAQRAVVAKRRNISEPGNHFLSRNK